MKAIQVFYAFLFLSYNCSAQQGASECKCYAIGLDSAWADSNKIKCYKVPVERNLIAPRGQTYHLAVAVAPSLGSSTNEPLLYLHGGPGIETISNVPRYLKSKAFTLLRQDRSVIFFDYRGTGFSEPVMCNWLADSSREITNLKLPLAERIQEIQKRYLLCKGELAKDQVMLNDFSSLQSASDADEIRKALGIQKWNIYSVSHGTTVGLHMMRNFPNGIRSIILDSPFPPNAQWFDFVRPFNQGLQVLEKAVKDDTTASHIFPSIRNDLRTIAARLKSSPLFIPLNGEKGSNKLYRFDDGDFLWSVWSAMLDPRSIPLIPIALKEMANGNDSVLLLWCKRYNDPNAFGKFALAQSKAILLYEVKPLGIEDRDNVLINQFPDFASLIAPGLDSSIASVFRSDQPANNYFDPVVSDIPTLIFSGEYDPVCPPLFGEKAAETLSNSQFVIVQFASHAAMYADDCTRNMARGFYQNPFKKLETDCLRNRDKIKFVTAGILELLR